MEISQERAKSLQERLDERYREEEEEENHMKLQQKCTSTTEVARAGPPQPQFPIEIEEMRTEVEQNTVNQPYCSTALSSSTSSLTLEIERLQNELSGVKQLNS